MPSLLRRAGALAALALVPIAVHAQSSTAGMAYQCPRVCTLPSCHCASAEPPAGLSRAETPQFVLVTFDDAIQDRLEDQAINLMFDGVRNPGGRPVHRTYFAQALYTSVARTRQLVAAGHEIANHTHDHMRGDQAFSARATEAEWVKELDDLERFMTDTVGVARGSVVGFRAPFLATSEAMWSELRRRGILYESSLTEITDAVGPYSKSLDALVWPHTLDGGSATRCVSSKCPDAPLPGLWSVPMWTIYKTDGRVAANMDPHKGQTDSTALYTLLMHNFEARYHGNRAPLGLFLHASTIRRKDHAIAGYRRFLRELSARGDVWIVTTRGLVEWMRRPVPSARMGAWFDGGGETGTYTPTTAEAVPGASGALVVGPNPVVDRALVRRAAGGPAATIEVTDALGRRVYAAPVPAGETVAEVVLGGVAPGVYLVRLGTETGRLVVRH